MITTPVTSEIADDIFQHVESERKSPRGDRSVVKCGDIRLGFMRTIRHRRFSFLILLDPTGFGINKPLRVSDQTFQPADREAPGSGIVGRHLFRLFRGRGDIPCANGPCRALERVRLLTPGLLAGIDRESRERQFSTRAEKGKKFPFQTAVTRCVSFQMLQIDGAIAIVTASRRFCSNVVFHASHPFFPGPISFRCSVARRYYR